MAKIINSNVFMVGIKLDSPFPLGFGTLSHLPRVFLELVLKEKDKLAKGYGEASIDFPFSDYDAYDIWFALKGLNIKGMDISKSISLLKHNSIQNLLKNFPAAVTAINMALDDAIGKLRSKSISDLYGDKRRNKGEVLSSIPFKKNIDSVLDLSRKQFKLGYVPKIKLGKNKKIDVAILKALESVIKPNNFKYAVDFNAQHFLEDIEYIFKFLNKNDINPKKLVFLEQPTKKSEGINALSKVREMFNNFFKFDVPVVADESFVSLADALKCTEQGVGLNYKIHKIGGLNQALLIERKILEKCGFLNESFVGGSFPTAIGRVYDQQCACILNSTNLPSDGLEPSTNWFTGDKHLIQEEFNSIRERKIAPIWGYGLGINIEWDKVEKFKIEDPKKEYNKIRHGEEGTKIKIQLNSKENYKAVYEKKSNRKYNWNL